MIDREIGSWDAVLAIREAEAIVRQKTGDGVNGPARRNRRRALARGLLAAGFLTLCFLPTLTVLAIVGLAIFLAR
ncbi:MAG TPA: hypothetical protein VJO15_01385 [Dehalococcoidia bacterium]|nr:hypothetical protein [Dehalococcoidia bacterium]